MESSHISSPAPQSLADTRVLFVTRDTTDRYSIKRYLESWGIALTSCSNSVQAFATLVNQVNSGKPIQTVIVDQRHLDMDPKQFAVSLRSEQTLQALYLIYLGPTALISQKEQLLNAGYSKLLATPPDKTLLFNALHNPGSLPNEKSAVTQLLEHYTATNNQHPLDILLADSNPNSQHRIRHLLQQAGHQVFLVQDGAEALDALDSHHFDLAIMEAKMQRVTGLEAFKLYRFTRLDQSWIPFIIMSNTMDTETLKACEEAGVDVCISKPADSQKLLNAINTAMEGRSTDTGSYNEYGVIADGVLIDIHQLENLESLGPSSDFLRKLVSQFSDESHNLLNDMQSAVNSCRCRQFSDIGHTLKDSAGSLGALDLYRFAIRATQLQDEDFPLEASHLMADIRNSRKQTLHALHEYLSERNNSASNQE